MPTGIYKRTEDHRRKLSEGQRGIPKPNLKGKHLSEEHRRKLSEIGKRRITSNETRRKMSETHKRIGTKPPSNKGKHFSEEIRRKMSELLKGHKRGLGQHLSEETKKKISEAHKGIKKPCIMGAKNPSWKGGINKDKKHTNELAKQREHKRRAFKKQTGSFYTLGEWELLKKQYEYKCPLCEKKEPEIKLTIDHIIPLSKGGSNWIENIQPLCQSCNSKKNTEIFRITPKGERMLF